MQLATTPATDQPAGAESRPPVSIVVRTCRGRLDFLRESLASLFAQTYSALQIVVIEDGSADAGPLVERLAASARRPILYRSIEKAGRCRAGNVGLALAGGRLLGFLDDDDRLFPGHVAGLVEALVRQPATSAAYSLACEVPTHVFSHEPLCYQEVTRYVVHRRRWQPAEMAGRNFLPIQGVLFRRELFERYGGFDERLECLEDWDLWRRYLAAGEFAHVDRVTSMHRVPADARQAHARYRQLQSYRPTLDRNWAAAMPIASAPPGPTIARRLATCIVAHAWPFRLYWHARLWWYARRQRRSSDDLYAA
ncbi:MAG TPA: glycosyltransferase [Pirellulales bacterium]|jgi:glycosyltransferase involved in cell wall biosynthesis|nr:glycosyltransferase [Pirellulales bacterium]